MNSFECPRCKRAVKVSALTCPYCFSGSEEFHRRKQSSTTEADRKEMALRRNLKRALPPFIALAIIVAVGIIVFIKER